MSPLFGFFGLGWGEILVLGIIGVLLFGKRLPDMAKYIGKSVVEFKKGMHGLESGFDDVGTAPTTAAPTSAQAEAIRPPQRVAPAAPKFDDVPVHAPAPVNTQITANPPQP
jgi:sec-independent protein translocase protein TatA